MRRFSRSRSGPDDEQPGRPLGDELEQRLDRPRAAEPQPLDLDRERVGERGRRPQCILDLLRADVLVLHRERDRPERDLGDVDDDQPLPRLDGGVDRELRRLRLEGHVEGDEHHRAAAGDTRDVGARAGASDPEHDYSGRSFQLFVLSRICRAARRLI